MFLCCSCLIAPRCAKALQDVCGEGVLSVLSSLEIVRQIERAGGVLGPNGNADPVCGTEQSGESSQCQGSRISFRDGLFQKPSP